MTHPPPDQQTGSVTSHDGTVIGYRRFGTGPAVVLTHGSMMASHNFLRLGSALRDRFTVYLPDRRGRGLSGPYGPDHSLQRAAEDVAALMEHTGAQRIFGLSGGAIPILKWALTAPEGYRIALYEPPLRVGTFSPTAWLPRYEREMAKGRQAAALVTVMKGTQDPPSLRFAPRAALVPLMDLAMRAQAKQVEQAGDGDVTLRELLPTMGPDARMVEEAAGLAEDATAVRARVLLLGGGASADTYRHALDALEAALPHTRRVEFDGLGHLAADNGGQPARVARVLADFFGDDPS